MLTCTLLYQQSKGFAARAKAALGARGVGWSVRCPINTAISMVLLLCFASQVYAKGSRAQPLIQLGWLLMPCHVITLVWTWVFLHQGPQHYATNCYLATLFLDWWWSPLAALLVPDRSDHVFPFESTIFRVHHGLLIGLPFYYALRYHTLGLSRAHVCHLTLIPVLISFGIFTVYALFTG
ncbi:hypothetical protein STCU_02227 [Strigomonas culicis]|nr:hypothetical protein STCU_02227 [Strigomonas culicis]|eukprot:EPY33420.1 hypothetical protein STCU_02227 [Strigomonas culicis]